MRTCVFNTLNDTVYTTFTLISKWRSRVIFMTWKLYLNLTLLWSRTSAGVFILRFSISFFKWFNTFWEVPLSQNVAICPEILFWRIYHVVAQLRMDTHSKMNSPRESSWFSIHTVIYESWHYTYIHISLRYVFIFVSLHSNDISRLRL